ncbi:hypothetical protein BT96DRAFT_845560, partial [Gymnopus androsaceus JB14]
FSIIFRIAQDLLAIPGVSVSVEWLFLKSWHLCADLQPSMKAETMTAAIQAKLWLKDGLFDFNVVKAVIGILCIAEN